MHRPPRPVLHRHGRGVRAPRMGLHDLLRWWRRRKRVRCRFRDPGTLQLAGSAIVVRPVPGFLLSCSGAASLSTQCAAYLCPLLHDATCACCPAWWSGRVAVSSLKRVPVQASRPPASGLPPGCNPTAYLFLYARSLTLCASSHSCRPAPPSGRRQAFATGPGLARGIICLVPPSRAPSPRSAHASSHGQVASCFSTGASASSHL